MSIYQGFAKTTTEDSTLGHNELSKANFEWLLDKNVLPLGRAYPIFYNALILHSYHLDEHAQWNDMSLSAHAKNNAATSTFFERFASFLLHNLISSTLGCGVKMSQIGSQTWNFQRA